jgi:hypothetical protein
MATFIRSSLLLALLFICAGCGTNPMAFGPLGCFVFSFIFLLAGLMPTKAVIKDDDEETETMSSPEWEVQEFPALEIKGEVCWPEWLEICEEAWTEQAKADENARLAAWIEQSKATIRTRQAESKRIGNWIEQQRIKRWVAAQEEKAAKKAWKDAEYARRCKAARQACVLAEQEAQDEPLLEERIEEFRKEILSSL